MNLLHTILSLPIEIKISASYGFITLANALGLLPSDWSIMIRLALAILLGIGLSLIAPSPVLKPEEVPVEKVDVVATGFDGHTQLIIGATGMVAIKQVDEE